MRSLIEQRLKEAVRALRKDEERRGDFLDGTHQTEWNLSYHLAKILSGMFPLHDCEIELSKVSHKRPDIVIHKRGTHAFNWLVVEVKRFTLSEDDRRKIREYWFQPPLSYRFGALVYFDGNVVEVLENPASIARGGLGAPTFPL
jgi:hypothetical protein